MSKKNKKYKRTVGVDEIKQLLEVISPDALIRVLFHLDKLGVIELDKSKPGKDKKNKKNK